METPEEIFRTNLCNFINKNKKSKVIINSVFERLSYDKTTKKFAKWPILLKDLLINLHDEIASQTPEKSQRNASSNKSKSKSSATKSNTKLIKVTKVEKPKIKLEIDDEVMEAEASPELKAKPAKNYEPQYSSNESMNSPDQRRNDSASDHGSLNKDHSEALKGAYKNEYAIDMNCNEVLDEIDKSESVTVRTVQSPNNQPKNLVTAEKVCLFYLSELRQISS